MVVFLKIIFFSNYTHDTFPISLPPSIWLCACVLIFSCMIPLSYQCNHWPVQQPSGAHIGGFSQQACLIFILKLPRLNHSSFHSFLATPSIPFLLHPSLTPVSFLVFVPFQPLLITS